MKKQKSSYAKILLAALSAILIYTLVTLLWTQKIETTISSSAIKSDQEYKVKQILFDLDGLEPILVDEQMIKPNQDGSLITSLALPGFSIGQQYLVRTCVATSGYQYDDSLICEGQGVGLEDNLDQYLLNICSEAVPIKGQGFMSPSRLVAKKQNQSIDQCSGLFAGESNPSLAIENGQLIDKLSGKSYGLENLLLTRVDQNTSLVDNQDGTYTFRGSDGEEVLINTSNSETVANLALSGNTLSYTNELGQIVGINLTGLSTDTLTYISVDSSSQLISYTNEADITTQIDIRSLETTTSLQVDISSQIIRYINEEGAVVTVDMTSLETISTLVDNNNGTYTYTNEDGASLTFENTLNTLNCTDGQSVAWNATTLEWECAALVGLDVLTMIGVSGSTLSYVDELGNTTNIDIKDLESTSTLVNNNNGTYTYTNEDGATATITDTLATLLCTDNQVASWDNTNSVWVCADGSVLETLTYLSLSVDGYTLEYQDENGSTTQINLETIIDNFETLTALSVNSLAGTLNYTDENGTANTIDLKPLIAANETLTTLTVSGSTITYTDEDGGTTDIDIKDLETLTTVAQSGQGSFTYTDEAGTTHTINTTDLINSSGDITITGSGTTADPYIVSFTETHTSFTGLSGTGKVIGTYTNENGDTFDLRETVTNLAINTTNQTITYTNENGTQVVADIKLLESTSTLVNNNNGTYTYTNEDGATATITDTLATLLCTDNQVA
ncbi:hypothetical protein KA531_02100, partial [Candidatus Saccharibacteria bacterium]|nr:hypothetical protein [Candidatus Saccharibacteria bacterium]